MKCYAHSKQNAPAEEWQKLEDHLENVASKSAEFAGAFSSSQWAQLLGCLHDYGKARASFQGYLARVSALNLMYANGGENFAKLLGCADAGHVFDAGHRKVAQTFRHRFHSFCRFDILLTAMLRQSFTDFIFVTNTDGSGKAASYVRALDMLGPILTKDYPKPIVGGSMWYSFSLADINASSWLGTGPSSRRRKCPIITGDESFGIILCGDSLYDECC